MALSGDQEALLTLLLVRGKSPDEIAGILETDRSDVEARIVDAIESVSPGEPSLPTPVALSLVGQADPIARADSASALAADPELAERAEKIRSVIKSRFHAAEGEGRSAKSRHGTPDRKPESASGDTVPETSPNQGAVETPGPVTPATGREAAAPVSTRRQLTPGNRRLLSILISAAGLVAVIAAVVLLAGGGDDDQPTDVGPTEARLSPAAGQTGRGSVEFGFAGTNFAANISLAGLEENRPGQSYALWLDGPVGAFPVERVKVGQQGSVAGQAVLNEAIICFIAADLFTDLKLARSGDPEFQDALRQAVRSGDGGPFPEYVGETVLTGRITMPDDTRETLVRECGGRNPEAGNQGS